MRKWFRVLRSKGGDGEVALVRLEGTDRDGVYKSRRGLAKLGHF